MKKDWNDEDDKQLARVRAKINNPQDFKDPEKRNIFEKFGHYLLDNSKVTLIVIGIIILLMII